MAVWILEEKMETCKVMEKQDSLEFSSLVDLG